jgi:hypothetical protein
LKKLVTLSEILSWFAIGAAFLSHQDVMGPVWPFLFGFAWLFTRLTGAPIVDDAYVYIGLSLLLCSGVAGYVAVASSESVVAALQWKSQSATVNALLALAYGVGLACAIRLVIMGGKSGEMHAELEEHLKRIDSTTFGTDTERKTNPGLLLVLLVITVCLAVPLLLM